MHNLFTICLLRILLPFYFFVGTFFILEAQDFENLISLSWENNPALKAKNFQLKQAEIALLEAKSRYGPQVGFDATYTLAAGGRSIDFPIGDLLNPVYGTLNQLTQSNIFPSIENQEVLFLPHNYLDAKIRLTQPIFYPDLKMNKAFKNKDIALKKLEIKAYKRLLSKEVMLAYFQWKMAEQVILIYAETGVFMEEAIRSTQSLYENGKALPSALSRLEAEQAKIDAQKIGAINDAQNAWLYLSFLLNTENILKDSVDVKIETLPTVPGVSNEVEAVQQMEIGLDIQKLALEKEQNFYKPNLGLQVDLGSQDYKFKWNPYALAGLNLQWNIYDHKKHVHKKDQVKAAIQSQIENQQQLENQISLQTAVFENNLIAAIKQAQTFQPRKISAVKTYQEIFKKYKEGATNYLELIDAQTQVTQTDISYIISKYKAWSKWAELIYVTAQLQID